MLTADELHEQQLKISFIETVKCKQCGDALPYDNVELLSEHWDDRGPWIFGLSCFCGWKARALITGKK